MSEKETKKILGKEYLKQALLFLKSMDYVKKFYISLESELCVTESTVQLVYHSLELNITFNDIEIFISVIGFEGALKPGSLYDTSRDKAFKTVEEAVTYTNKLIKEFCDNERKN